jgi:hypothetical protein
MTFLSVSQWYNSDAVSLAVSDGNYVINYIYLSEVLNIIAAML